MLQISASNVRRLQVFSVPVDLLFARTCDSTKALALAELVVPTPHACFLSFLDMIMLL